MCAAKHRLFLDVPIAKMQAFREGLLQYFKDTQPALVAQLDIGDALTEEMEQSIKDTVLAYKSR